MLYCIALILSCCRVGMSETFMLKAETSKQRAKLYPSNHEIKKNSYGKSDQNQPQSHELTCQARIKGGGTLGRAPTPGTE